jgi:hypothetical protein
MRAFVFFACALALVSCIDPVHDDAVTALGGEASGVRPGPTHRPGQPCLVCHGGHGPGSPEMSVAGTVVGTRGSTQGVSGVTVTLTDATGVTKTLRSNGAGNYYFFKTEWDPAFPLSASVASGSTQQVMKSQIEREGSCATCHAGTGDATHMPAVFVGVQ